MKPKQITDISSYQVIGPASIRRRKKLVVIGIARHAHVRKGDH